MHNHSGINYTVKLKTRLVRLCISTSRYVFYRNVCLCVARIMYKNANGITDTIQRLKPTQISINSILAILGIILQYTLTKQWLYKLKQTI